MGVGIIVRDHQGRVSVALSRTIKAMQEPGTTEAMRALSTAEFTKDLGIPDIILEGGCLQVVNAIKGAGTSWSPYGQVVGDARMVLNT